MQVGSRISLPVTLMKTGVCGSGEHWIYGLLSGGFEDLDEQIVDPKAIAEAIPLFMSPRGPSANDVGGPIRWHHNDKFEGRTHELPVGSVTALWQDEQNFTHFQGILSRVTQDAINLYNLLVEGLTKFGASIGGVILQIQNRWDPVKFRLVQYITKIRIDEISITDNPAFRTKDQLPNGSWGSYVVPLCSLTKSAGPIVWAPEKHPRDSKGEFASNGGTVLERHVERRNNHVALQTALSNLKERACNTGLSAIDKIQNPTFKDNPVLQAIQKSFPPLTPRQQVEFNLKMDTIKATKVNSSVDNDGKPSEPVEDLGLIKFNGKPADEIGNDLIESGVTGGYNVTSGGDYQFDNKKAVSYAFYSKGTLPGQDSKDIKNQNLYHIQQLKKHLTQLGVPFKIENQEGAVRNGGWPTEDHMRLTSFPGGRIEHTYQQVLVTYPRSDQELERLTSLFKDTSSWDVPDIRVVGYDHPIEGFETAYVNMMKADQGTGRFIVLSQTANNSQFRSWKKASIQVLQPFREYLAQ